MGAAVLDVFMQCVNGWRHSSLCEHPAFRAYIYNKVKGDPVGE